MDTGLNKQKVYAQLNNAGLYKMLVFLYTFVNICCEVYYQVNIYRAWLNVLNLLIKLTFTT